MEAIMGLTLKSQLQYERDFCNLMCDLGYHAERVSASGKRKKSVCDAVVITPIKTYLVEVKATKEKVFYLHGLHGITEVAQKYNVLPLLAVRFKGNSHKKGKWVCKIITPNLNKITIENEPDKL
jgi:Holliday junction resolvase